MRETWLPAGCRPDVSTMGHNVLRLVVVLLVIGLAAGVQAYPVKGYVARPSGFDHNGDGVFDTTVCNGSDATAAIDIDRNGVLDNQCYVDCTGGTDTPTCGAPGAPCKTLQYCMNGSNTSTRSWWRIATPAAGQIQAICFKGICSNAALNLTQSGASGTWTKTASGSEPRNWEYARYPLIISGWDANQNHDYPPHDTADTAIVDGNVSGNTNTFFNSGGHSRYELAH